jgi:hypothetical protein
VALATTLVLGVLLLIATFLAKRYLRKGLLGKVVAPTIGPDTTLVITDIEVRSSNSTREYAALPMLHSCHFAVRSCF